MNKIITPKEDESTPMVCFVEIPRSDATLSAGK